MNWYGRQREAICPHPECGRGVIMQLEGMEVVHPQHVQLGGTHSHDPTADLDTRITEEAWSCTYCKRTTRELIWWEKDKDTAGDPKFLEVKRQTVWPEPFPRDLPPEVPEEIRSLFRESARTESVGAVRLAGAGYRAVVEEICKHQGAVGRSLYDKITALESDLTPDIINSLHEARMVGNDSLHDGLEYSPDELADIAQLVTEVTFILYVHPAQRAAFAAARAARRAGK
ncbi:DUF4145 domain-containing protein [[Kitasatospora] papulosa]|uniref:DUF4145 domain-containing protein n=1 Tax=[Kitasatospora] papulosa TaxID=1464011 RepID=UPI00382D5608